MAIVFLHGFPRVTLAALARSVDVILLCLFKASPPMLCWEACIGQSKLSFKSEQTSKRKQKSKANLINPTDTHGLCIKRANVTIKMSDIPRTKLLPKKDQHSAGFPWAPCELIRFQAVPAWTSRMDHGPYFWNSRKSRVTSSSWQKVVHSQFHMQEGFQTSHPRIIRGQLKNIHLFTCISPDKVLEMSARGWFKRAPSASVAGESRLWEDEAMVLYCWNPCFPTKNIFKSCSPHLMQLWSPFSQRRCHRLIKIIKNVLLGPKSIEQQWQNEQARHAHTNIDMISFMLAHRTFWNPTCLKPVMIGFSLGRSACTANASCKQTLMGRHAKKISYGTRGFVWIGGANHEPQMDLRMNEESCGSLLVHWQTMKTHMRLAQHTFDESEACSLTPRKGCCCTAAMLRMAGKSGQ